jgi:hypothetical protein
MRTNLKINNILTNITKNFQFDKYNQISCSDCIYFVSPFFVNHESPKQDFSRCRKIMYKNIDTGAIDLSFTQMNRQFEHLCGSNAKYKKTSYINSSIDKESIIIHPIKIE